MTGECPNKEEVSRYISDMQTGVTIKSVVNSPEETRYSFSEDKSGNPFALSCANQRISVINWACWHHRRRCDFLKSRIVPMKNQGNLLQADVVICFDKAAQFVVNISDNIHTVVLHFFICHLLSQEWNSTLYSNDLPVSWYCYVSDCYGKLCRIMLISGSAGVRGHADGGISHQCCWFIVYHHAS